MNWVWAIGAPLVRAIMSIVCRVRIEGIEHVPRTGAVIVAPNHVSVLDGPAVSATVGTHRWRATRNLIAAEVFRRRDRLDPAPGAPGADPPRHGRHRRARRGHRRGAGRIVRGHLPRGSGERRPPEPACSASVRGSRASRSPPARRSCPWASGARTTSGRRKGSTGPRCGAGTRSRSCSVRPSSRTRMSRPASSASAIERRSMPSCRAPGR